MKIAEVSDIDLPGCFTTGEFVRKDSCIGKPGDLVCEHCYFACHYVSVNKFTAPMPRVDDLDENFLKRNTYEED